MSPSRRSLEFYISIMMKPDLSCVQIVYIDDAKTLEKYNEIKSFATGICIDCSLFIRHFKG